MTSRTIIAGSRGITDQAFVFRILAWHARIGDTLITGGCPTGVDAIAEKYAKIHAATGSQHDSGYRLSLEVYKADWGLHGKAAGPIRNGDMANIADKLVAIWDSKSRGTRNMIEQALERGLEVHVYRYPSTGDKAP